jgi:autotransporter-associated beta strand protein
LTLSGANSATITVALGTLKAGGLGSLGTAGVTVNAGATLDVNAMSFNNAEPITVSGAGVGSNGAIVNNATNQTKVLRVVTLSTNSTIGGSGDWDIRSSQAGSAVNGDGQLNGTYNLTKVGTNTVTLFGVQVDPGLADMDVQAGTLSVERNTTGLGNPTNSIRVYTNATLQFQNASNAWNKVVVLKDGATFKNTTINATFQGPVTLESGVGTITANSAQFTLTNVISGAGGLTKTGTNTLVLTSSNIYSGSTLISGGTLALTGAGALAASSVLTVAGGSTLDASGRSDGTLTLGSGQTLKGNGLVLGAVVATNGSAIAPGSSVGILTISNALSLAPGSATTMELDKGNQTNDLLRGLTSISYGGALNVTNLSGTLAAGDSFQLFLAGSYNGTFAATNFPALASGLGWTNTLSTDGRIAVISVVNLAPTNIVVGMPSPNALDLSWPLDHTGWTLQAQTNSADVGLGTNWAPVTGSASTNHVVVTIDPANGTVFYRLVYP